MLMFINVEPMKLIVKSIEVPTVLNEDKLADQIFYDYLEEYSIAHKVVNEEEYPLVEYTGGVISLSNMLKEKFGYTKEEIQEYYPQLLEEN
jgi:hypothetical protein